MKHRDRHSKAWREWRKLKAYVRRMRELGIQTSVEEMRLGGEPYEGKMSGHYQLSVAAPSFNLSLNPRSVLL